MVEGYGCLEWKVNLASGFRVREQGREVRVQCIGKARQEGEYLINLCHSLFCFCLHFLLRHIWPNKVWRVASVARQT